MAAWQELNCPEVWGWLRNAPAGLLVTSLCTLAVPPPPAPPSTQAPRLDLGSDKSLGAWGSPAPFPEKSLVLHRHPVGIRVQAVRTAKPQARAEL